MTSVSSVLATPSSGAASYMPSEFPQQVQYAQMVGFPQRRDSFIQTRRALCCLFSVPVVVRGL